MSFPYNAYAVAAVSAFLTCCLALPWWRRWCLRTGLVDDPGQRKIHDQPVPLAGGMAVMTGLVAPIFGAVFVLALIGAGGLQPPASSPQAPAAPSPVPGLPLDLRSIYLLQYGVGRRGFEVLIIILGALGMLTLGWLDDRQDLRPALKFAGQFFVATLVAASGARITLFVHSVLFSYAVTILWILTVVNAFNFMDNMNGLCAGLGAIAAWSFGWVAAAGGQYLVALIAFLTFGSLLGFLPYNFPRASAFLGDAGSHLVGYLLAVLAILPHFYTRHNPHRLAVLIPLAVLAVPLVDLVWVVLLRLRKGQPFYVGDTNHLSHRLVRRGASRSLAVLIIWLAAALCGAAACW